MSAPTSTELRLTDQPGRRPSGLVAAFLVALGLHALALALVLSYRLAPPAPPGEQRVSVDLAPVMAEAPTQVPTEQRLSESIPLEAKPVEDPLEEATRPAPAEVAEVGPDEVQPVTAAPQAAVEPPPDARPIEPLSPLVTSMAEQAEPLAPPPPQAMKALAPKVEPVEPKPDSAKPKAEREAKLRKVREERRREEKRQERVQERLEERLEEMREANAAREARAKASQARQGADARDSAAASRRSASGRAAAGDDPGALRQWTGAISAAIHGRMNPGAAVGTGGGTALVRFTVLRSGAVTSSGLARSSGVGQIDSAALAAVRGRLPTAPPGVAQASLSVTIPLNYQVR